MSHVTSKDESQDLSWDGQRDGDVSPTPVQLYSRRSSAGTSVGTDRGWWRGTNDLYLHAEK